MTQAQGATEVVLVRNATESLRRGDIAGALTLLDQALELAPTDTPIMMLKAAALRRGGDLEGALRQVEALLAIDPNHFVGQFLKGSLLEILAGPRVAARHFSDILPGCPPESAMPPNMAAQVAHARKLVADNAAALASYLRDQIAEAKARHGAASLRRLEEALDVYAGVSKPVVQQPLLMHYPQLPAIPFYDRDHFPWLPRLEAATEMISAELIAALEGLGDSFAPYVAYPPGVNVGQWRQLNNSLAWRSLWLWRDGERQDAVCAACPNTSALLESLPLADQPGFAPTVLFSALEARTRIPPHTGSTNARLLVHLPLNLPGPARFRVGNETRDWRMGEAWVFDDSIEHEAWNDADALRVILIFDVWNPYLSEAERDLIGVMMKARNAYYSSGTSPT